MVTAYTYPVGGGTYMAIFTTVSEHLTACNAFFLQTGEDIISAVHGGCGGMRSLGDTPCLSAGRKPGLASSGGEGPQPTLTPQTQSIALLDMMPRMVPPELNVSFGVMLCPPHQTHLTCPALCDVLSLPNMGVSVPLHRKEKPGPQGTGTLAFLP